MQLALVAWSVCVWGLLAVAGCGDDDGPAQPDAAAQSPDAAQPDASGCNAPIAVFLNRGGGVYTKGDQNDSSTNTTTIIVNPSATIEPADFDDGAWTELLACVADKFAAFNVVVTDVDPGAAPHREAVFVGNPTQVPPLDNQVVIAVAPTVCSEAGEDPLPRGIVLLNALRLTNATARCEVTAQMLGNTFGLDHSFHCPDLMTYLSGCGDKTFVDMDVPCGEVEARPCMCGNTPTQNSFRAIDSIAGTACP